jgi:hypothetical protein
MGDWLQSQQISILIPGLQSQQSGYENDKVL